MSTKCKIQINVDDRGWMWIDAEVKTLMSDGRYLVYCRKADQTFFCTPEEVYVTLQDMQTEMLKRLLSFE